MSIRIDTDGTKWARYEDLTAQYRYGYEKGAAAERERIRTGVIAIGTPRSTRRGLRPVYAEIIDMIDGNTL